MTNVFKYITKQPFWVNLIAALLLVFLLGFLFLQSLSWFTNHGDYLKVPSVKGKNVDEAIKLLEDNGFDVVIQDSVFNDTAQRYTVLKQLPDPDATVKRNRTVFLTINRAVPPDIEMPKLEGLSLRFAIDMLQRNHLKFGDTTFRPDFMKGSVLEQDYRGAKIEAGTKIPWGAKIDLVIGAGVQEQQMPVPDLLGLTFSEAKAMLDGKGITLASVIPDHSVTDTSTAFVYKQNPEIYDDERKTLFIRAGQTMDIWLTQNHVDVDSLRHKNIPPVDTEKNLPQ